MIGGWLTSTHKPIRSWRQLSTWLCVLHELRRCFICNYCYFVDGSLWVFYILYPVKCFFGSFSKLLLRINSRGCRILFSSVRQIVIYEYRLIKQINFDWLIVAPGLPGPRCIHTQLSEDYKLGFQSPSSTCRSVLGQDTELQIVSDSCAVLIEKGLYIDVWMCVIGWKNLYCST